MSRTGMTAIIEELRGLAEAGTAEYTIGTTLYWSDNALQDVLDINRKDIVFAPLALFPVVGANAELEFYEYRSAYDFLEVTSAGTSILYLQDSTGAKMGTALYTADYRRGVFTFTNDTQGTALYLTARSYDLNAAAADLWSRKSSHYAPTMFDFSTDNHSISRGQVYTHCQEMSNYFTGISRKAIQSVSTYRSDISSDGYE